MNKLILNPKKLNFKSREKKFFLGKWFLYFLGKNKLKKIKYFFVNSSYTNTKKQIKQIFYAKKIYKDILEEIYPKLNKIHSIEWRMETWNFFLGHWLHAYIIIILDRLELIKPIIKNKKNFDLKEIIKFGKNTNLVNNDLKKFTENAGRIEWNEKLISRIIYLKIIKKFNNSQNFKKKNYLSKSFDIQSIIFILKVKVLKFFSSLISKKSDIIFYNTGIKDKFILLKLFLKNNTIPFQYSFPFFNQKIINENLNSDLRKKIMLNYEKEKNIDNKIIKFLFAENFPIIYLEGFSLQNKISKSSHLPNNIRAIFTSSAYTDNSFKFWLADKINNKISIFYGQHGVNYNIRKNYYHQDYELSFSKKYFIWGAKKNNPKMVSVGNFQISQNAKKISCNFFNALVLIPLFDIFKRFMILTDMNQFENDLKQINIFFKNIKSFDKNIIQIKPHPQNNRRTFNYEDFLNFDRNKIKVLNPRENFQKLADNFAVLVFTSLSTEFLKQLALNKPCLIFLNTKEINEYYIDSAKKDFLELKKIGILHVNGLSLSNKLNEISNNVNKWWFAKKTQMIVKKFCKKYSSPKFDFNLFLKTIKN